MNNLKTWILAINSAIAQLDCVRRSITIQNLFPGETKEFYEKYFRAELSNLFGAVLESSTLKRIKHLEFIDATAAINNINFWLRHPKLKEILEELSESVIDIYLQAKCNDFLYHLTGDPQKLSKAINQYLGLAEKEEEIETKYASIFRALSLVYISRLNLFDLDISMLEKLKTALEKIDPGRIKSNYFEALFEVEIKDEWDGTQKKLTQIQRAKDPKERNTAETKVLEEWSEWKAKKAKETIDRDIAFIGDLIMLLQQKQNILKMLKDKTFFGFLKSEEFHLLEKTFTGPTEKLIIYAFILKIKNQKVPEISQSRLSHLFPLTQYKLENFYNSKRPNSHLIEIFLRDRFLNLSTFSKRTGIAFLQGIEIDRENQTNPLLGALVEKVIELDAGHPALEKFLRYTLCKSTQDSSESPHMNNSFTMLKNIRNVESHGFAINLFTTKQIVEWEEHEIFSAIKLILFELNKFFAEQEEAKLGEAKRKEIEEIEETGTFSNSSILSSEEIERALEKFSTTLNNSLTISKTNNHQNE